MINRLSAFVVGYFGMCFAGIYSIFTIFKRNK